MTKRRKITFFFVAAVSLSAAIHFALQPRQPVYQGRTLSSWLDDLDYEVDAPKVWKASDAIKKIGSPALPQIIKLLKAEDSMYSRLGVELLTLARVKQSRFVPAWRHHWKATLAFRALGPRASPAVPELVAMLPDTEQKMETLEALGLIGPAAEEAVPAIIQCLKDGSGSVRCAAAEALGRIAGHPELAVPALIKALEHPQPNTRWHAADALGAFGESAKSSVPALENILNDPSAEARTNAANSLQKIAASIAQSKAVK